MTARVQDGARAPGRVTAESDEASAGGTARGFQEGTTSEADCASAPRTAQALKVIEAERRAREYLARLQAEQADPDELALIVAMLYGAALRGFCRVIAKALG